MKHTNIFSFFTVILMLCSLNFSCGKQDKDKPEVVTVFLAPAFSPVWDAVRQDAEKQLNIELHGEISGSQVVCRKVTELGREADLMLVADNRLFKQIASSHTNFRIDFAHDEVVLGIGIRAKRVDEAEDDWLPVLLDENVRLGRVDENLGPIGYRTLLVWKLKEMSGYPGLMQQLVAKTAKVVEHVGHLATNLKAGDIDYGFLYRTTCIKHDIRFISLDERINLGSMEMDYSVAQVSFKKLEAGKEVEIPVQGAPITYSLSIPSNAPNRKKAIELIHYLLHKDQEQFSPHGFTFFTPKFYGSQEDFAQFKDIVEYAGSF
jgi:molybdate/tungstate transport system substrate-binding protein